MTAKEILLKHGSDNVSGNKEYFEPGILKAMHEFASQQCEKQRVICTDEYTNVINQARSLLSPQDRYDAIKNAPEPE